MAMSGRVNGSGREGAFRVDGCWVVAGWGTLSSWYLVFRHTSNTQEVIVVLLCVDLPFTPQSNRGEIGNTSFCFSRVQLSNELSLQGAWHGNL